MTVGLQVGLPTIPLSAFNITDLISMAQGLALSTPVPIFGLPSLPTLGSLLSVNVTGIGSFISAAQQSIATMMTQGASGASGAFTQLMSTLGDAAVIPDELESIFMALSSNSTSSITSSISSSISSALTSSSQYDASTGFLAPSVWAVLPADIKAAVLAIINAGKAT